MSYSPASIERSYSVLNGLIITNAVLNGLILTNDVLNYWNCLNDKFK